MSKDPSKQPEEPKGTPKKFFEESLEWRKFLWNPKTREFLGRNAESWGKITAFYVVFYAFLAGYFAVMMTVFYHTLEEDRPKYTSLGGESLLSTPGLSKRPDVHNKIEYSITNNDTYDILTSSINKLIEKYDHAKIAGGLRDCSGGKPSVTEACDFDVTPLKEFGSADSNWGFDTPSPTIVLKLNKVFDWEPKVLKSDSNKLPKELRSYIKENMTDAANSQMVWLWCTPKDGVTFTYSPQPGFPAYYFPFLNQQMFLAPLVAVKIHDIPEETEIWVECFAYADNMKDVSIKFIISRS